MARFGCEADTFQPPPGLSFGMSENCVFRPPAGTWSSMVFPTIRTEMEEAVVPREDEKRNLSEEANRFGTPALAEEIAENKEVRRLEKKLREITKLEERAASGEELDSLQLIKLQGKSKLETMLEAAKEKGMQDLWAQFRSTFQGKDSTSTKPPVIQDDVLTCAGSSRRCSVQDDVTTCVGSAISDRESETSEDELLSADCVGSRSSGWTPVFGGFNKEAPLFFPDAATQAVVQEHLIGRTPLRAGAQVFVPRYDVPAKTRLTSGSQLFVPKWPELSASKDMATSRATGKALQSRSTGTALRSE